MYIHKDGKFRSRTEVLPTFLLPGAGTAVLAEGSVKPDKGFSESENERSAAITPIHALDHSRKRIHTLLCLRK